MGSEMCIRDRLSIYIFHIKPLPGCGNDAAAANATGLALPASCEAAPSAEQFNFAGIILLLGAAMIGLFKDDKAGGAIIPSMMGARAIRRNFGAIPVTHPLTLAQVCPPAGRSPRRSSSGCRSTRSPPSAAARRTTAPVSYTHLTLPTTPYV